MLSLAMLHVVFNNLLATVSYSKGQRNYDISRERLVRLSLSLVSACLQLVREISSLTRPVATLQVWKMPS